VGSADAKRAEKTLIALIFFLKSSAKISLISAISVQKNAGLSALSSS